MSDADRIGDLEAVIPTEYDLASYAYALPRERIAQVPVHPRDSSRLMWIREGGSTEHRSFRDLPGLLPERALLVLNETRVIRARLLARKESGGHVELLLLPEPGAFRPDTARFLARGKLRLPGTRLRVGDSWLVLLDREEGGVVRLRAEAGEAFDSLLHRHGHLPLPPYIDRPGGATEADDTGYQTVYAREPGAVAAPTAGLHFTDSVLDALKRRDIEIGRVRLHVGPGTFQPVRCRDVREHRVLPEPSRIGPELARAVGRARAEGRAVVAVGTTVVRALEGAALRAGPGEVVAAGEAAEDLVILPGHPFRVVDALLTNFHLPSSSLLLLVAAFIGRRRLLSAYAEAVAAGYRFYSYGDAMYLAPRDRGRRR